MKLTELKCPLCANRESCEQLGLTEKVAEDCGMFVPRAVSESPRTTREFRKNDCVKGVEAAAELLISLAKLPFLVSIDFRFRFDVGSVPLVTYEISQYAIGDQTQ